MSQSIPSGTTEVLQKKAQQPRTAPLLVRLFPFIRAHFGKFLALLIIMAISSIIGLLPPLFMGIAIDQYLVKPNLKGVLIICIMIILYGAIEGIIGFLGTYVREYLGNKIIMDMRIKMYTHVNQLSFSYFDKTRTGDIMARVMQDTQQLQMYMTMGLVNLATNLVTLVGVLVILFVWNGIVGTIFLIDLPFIMIGMAFFSRRVAPANMRMRKANGIIGASIQDCLAGIREVKLYGREEFMLRVFDTWNQEYYNSMMDSTRQSAFWMPYVPFLVSASSGIVLLLGGLFVVGKTFSIGELIATVAYFTQLINPLRMITRFLGLHAVAKAAGTRIFEILDKKSSIADEPGAVPLAEVEGNVEFKHVSFQYEPGHDILTDINLNIPAGKIVAFVGPSGVGKTTLLHMLPRFYDPVEGEILMDGKNIRSFKVDSLRKNVGIAMQDTYLFDGTISDNITFGNTQASKEEIQEAARVARLDKFIESLPAGYKTFVGERGVFLSGGQAQRLSLARVLVTNPKILILDEPTANVDAVTDKEIMDAVRATMRGRTTLIIAHRLWTIQHAEQIVLLKNGRIEATGTHQELMETSSFYREFFSSQIQEPNGIKTTEMVEGEES
ncbi:MAG TPA: ABC transporter ATP-binding protein [Candidatus Lokiarchaeia archaeon]|nr:ABC transporter ATP-binding protein [Candidatus Lokiarchaeia archaeon]